MKMLVILVYFLRIQLISLSPFHAFLTPLSPSTEREMHIGDYTFFNGLFISLLGYYILVGNAFSLGEIKTAFIFK